MLLLGIEADRRGRKVHLELRSRCWDWLVSDHLLNTKRSNGCSETKTLHILTHPLLQCHRQQQRLLAMCQQHLFHALLLLVLILLHQLHETVVSLSVDGSDRLGRRRRDGGGGRRRRGTSRAARHASCGLNK